MPKVLSRKPTLKGKIRSPPAEKSRQFTSGFEALILCAEALDVLVHAEGRFQACNTSQGIHRMSTTFDVKQPLPCLTSGP